MHYAPVRRVSWGPTWSSKRARRESWLAVSPVGDRVAQSRTLRRLNEAFHAGEDVHGRVRALIADSWARCSSAGLTARTQTDSVLDDREIEERWGDHLLRPLMPLLEELLSGATNEAAHLLAITDAKGIVLWKGGDREIVSATDEIAFVRGADWSERGAGTNAMGTAIAVDHQVQIFSAEHFSMDVHPWHCCAAPVHDPATGELAAVIDLTGRLKTAHPHTLGLVTAAAGVAETYLRRDLAVHDERAKALFLARVTGTRERTALLRRNGEVVAAAPAGWTSGTVELPPTAAETVALAGRRDRRAGDAARHRHARALAPAGAPRASRRRRPARTAGARRRPPADHVHASAPTRCRRAMPNCWRSWRWPAGSCRPRS